MYLDYFLTQTNWVSNKIILSQAEPNFSGKFQDSNRKGIRYYKMITNNNFNPLRVFCQQTFDFWLPLLPLWSDNDGTDSWQKRGFSWSMRKERQQRGGSKGGKKIFLSGLHILEGVGGLGTIY